MEEQPSVVFADDGLVTSPQQLLSRCLFNLLPHSSVTADTAHSELSTQHFNHEAKHEAKHTRCGIEVGVMPKVGVVCSL